ncbi:hypothetical protein [Pelagicoccus mobilis]|uniref:Lipocalin-like domain-containing protein n=1 Tax=Pelagicoccus mobilis TaxID=415221 RepID=A0A934RVI2_9BACT|nr:hypothetical protein [Pelagicoccus mobilis]MBK1876195.1 hypothetical protein [Pelagicoccus mobilis]
MLTKLFSLAFLSALFTLHGDVDPELLIGTWKFTYHEENNLVIDGTSVYNPDGTFTGHGTVTIKDELVEEFETRGTWSIEGRTLTYIGKFVNQPDHPLNGKPITAEILSMTKDVYYYRGEDGKVRHETRIQN